MNQKNGTLRKNGLNHRITSFIRKSFFRLRYLSIGLLVSVTATGGCSPGAGCGRGFL